MGSRSIVYGYIEGVWLGPGSPKNELLRGLNAAAIEALPITDDWPFLTRSLFKISDPTVDGGGYRNHIVHFGGSFKQIEDDWAAWLAKFERLLSQMYWETAEAHLLTEFDGEFSYCWEVTREAFLNMRDLDPPRPAGQWTFEGLLPAIVEGRSTEEPVAESGDGQPAEAFSTDGIPLADGDGPAA